MIKTTEIFLLLFWFMGDVLNRTCGSSSIWTILSNSKVDSDHLTSTTKLTETLEYSLTRGRVPTNLMVTTNQTRFPCSGYNFSTINHKNQIFIYNQEMCEFAADFNCLMHNLDFQRVFFYFDDFKTYQFAEDLLHNNHVNEQKQHHSFYIGAKEEELFQNLRSFVISVLQSTIDVVVVYLKEELFQLLMQIWIREGNEKTVSWLYVSRHGLIEYYAPKCQDFHSPVVLPLMKVNLLRENKQYQCIDKIFDELSQIIKRCNRRKNLPILRATVKLEAPWIMETKGVLANNKMHCENSIACDLPIGNSSDVAKMTWKKSCCTGSMIEILLEIFKLAGIKRFRVYGVPDNKYGAIVSCPNGERINRTKCQWSGLFNELIQKKADIAVTALTWNSDRAAVADLPEFINLSPMGIVRHRETRTTPLFHWSFIQAWDPYLALALLVTFVVLYISLLVIDNSSNLTKRRSFYTAHEILTYLSGLTFQRDLGGRNPYFWSARIPSIMYAFATTIIMTTYTADLTAKGVVIEESDFNGLHDERLVNPTSDFIFSIPEATYTYNLFQTNVDKRYPKAAIMMKPYNSQGDIDGIENVFQKKVDAYISDYESMSTVVNLAKYCPYLILESLKNPLPYSFAFQKDSKFTPFFSKYIFDLKYNKKIEIISKKWYYRSEHCAGSFATAQQFDFFYALGLETLLMATALFCVLVLLFENLLARCRRGTIGSK